MEMISKKQKVTIKDVAQLAQMSVTTVSCVMNGQPGFPEETRKKVWDAVHQLNFVPSKSARQMRSGGDSIRKGDNKLIMHIVHAPSSLILTDSVLFYENKFLAQVNHIVTFQAMRHGYFKTDYFYHADHGFRCPLLLNGMVDGVLIGTPHLDVVQLLRGHIPMVLMDMRAIPEVEGLPVVNTDLASGFENAFAAARTAGYGKAAFFHETASKENSLAMHYVPLIRTAMLANGLIPVPEYDISQPLCPATNEKIAAEYAAAIAEPIRKKEIDLVVASSDVFMRLLLKNLAALGISIPGDAGAIALSFDPNQENIPYSRVALNWGEMSATSMDTLIQMIEGKTDFCKQYLVEPIVNLGPTLRRHV